MFDILVRNRYQYPPPNVLKHSSSLKSSLVERLKTRSLSEFRIATASSLKSGQDTIACKNALFLSPIKLLDPPQVQALLAF